MNSNPTPNPDSTPTPPPPRQAGAGIQSAIVQTFLASARNAAARGQSQFHTPPALGKHLAGALPDHRPEICDLSCGNAGLLYAAAVRSQTTSLLGADIDPVKPVQPNDPELPKVNRLTADLTRLYPLLVDVGWHADCFVLNPPWGLEWYRDRLSALGESDCEAVKFSFLAQTGPVIDSTIATLMIALDRSRGISEGYLIANAATTQRLIFAADAPFHQLRHHIWARVRIPGNPMTRRDDCAFVEGDPFTTDVLYFSRAYQSGYLSKAADLEWAPDWSLDRRASLPLPSRWGYRGGAAINHHYQQVGPCIPQWNAVAQQLATEAGERVARPFHIWLQNGAIATHLDDFQRLHRKADLREIEALFKLNGQTPMALVLQRADREELLRVLGEAPATGTGTGAARPAWKVSPELRAAVAQALLDYHACRAPLYALPQIQRLGYLDEQDEIQCLKDLHHGPPGRARRHLFTAGERYGLRSHTLTLTRDVVRPNSQTGEPEAVEYIGQELAFFILDNHGNRVTFLPQEAMADGVSITADRAVGYDPNSPKLPLQVLADHFAIPEVPDVAQLQPAQYAQNLAALTTLEQFLATAPVV